MRERKRESEKETLREKHSHYYTKRGGKRKQQTILQKEYIVNSCNNRIREKERHVLNSGKNRIREKERQRDESERNAYSRSNTRGKCESLRPFKNVRIFHFRASFIRALSPRFRSFFSHTNTQNLHFCDEYHRNTTFTRIR